jgi:hypothetical protein
LFYKLFRYSKGEVRVAIDGTLCGKGGPHIFGASMHYDARTSTYGRGTSAWRSCFFAFGHNWAVMSLWIQLPWSQDRGLATPFLFRLYRSKKRCPKSKHRKLTVIAAEMVDLVAIWLPAGRTLHALGDSEYACKTVERSLPDSAVFTDAMCMDATLHEPPPPYSGTPSKPWGSRIPEWVVATSYGLIAIKKKTRAERQGEGRRTSDSPHASVRVRLLRNHDRVVPREWQRRTRRRKSPERSPVVSTQVPPLLH